MSVEPYNDTVTVTGLKVVFKSVPFQIFKPPFLIFLAFDTAKEKIENHVNLDTKYKH